jgi:uncharacterized membrane protein YfcA
LNIESKNDSHKKWAYALFLFLMGVFNIAGNILGTRLALKKGNQFVRSVFLIIVSIMILRYSYDVFLG